ncbi:hypothetical protein [Sphingomonas sp.]|uniref:hypothetical protein n=1 Tax=Sphingomonas sp. TaxID=28214 RepID=UPI0017AA1A50|nr:hypothetical protein [Sphingomonas sp.]MBA3510399.1 hypothetical protein [Sphingomonas sp.]
MAAPTAGGCSKGCSKRSPSFQNPRESCQRKQHDGPEQSVPDVLPIAPQPHRLALYQCVDQIPCFAGERRDADGGEQPPIAETLSEHDCTDQHHAESDIDVQRILAEAGDLHDHHLAALQNAHSSLPNCLAASRSAVPLTGKAR